MSQQGGCPQGDYPQDGHPLVAYPAGGYPQATTSTSRGYPPPPQPGSQPTGYDEHEEPVFTGPGDSLGEDSDVKGFDFSEQSIQKPFIRKVYGILMCQLLVTMSFTSLFVYHAPTKIWVQKNTYTFWIALALVLICLIGMKCCPSVRRTAPMNFIFLGIFTVAEIFLLGVTSSMYQSNRAVMALGITAAVCFGLIIFTMQTKWDFTTLSGSLIAVAIVLLLFGIVAFFVPSKIINLVFASLGAFFFSTYLIGDIQLMMAGEHEYSVSPEEYVFGALNLYLDALNVFALILAVIRAAICK